MTCTTVMALRVFHASAPKEWNGMAIDLRSSNSHTLYTFLQKIGSKLTILLGLQEIDDEDDDEEDDDDDDIVAAAADDDDDDDDDYDDDGDHDCNHDDAGDDDD